MKIFFYSHLIEIESIVMELDKMNLSKEQKTHLTSLVDSNLHNTILDAILSQLNSQDKRIFLNYLKEDDKSKIWQFLDERIDNIEERIKKMVDSLKLQLHQDLKRAKKV